MQADDDRDHGLRGLAQRILGRVLRWRHAHSAAILACDPAGVTVLASEGVAAAALEQVRVQVEATGHTMVTSDLPPGLLIFPVGDATPHRVALCLWIEDPGSPSSEELQLLEVVATIASEALAPAERGDGSARAPSRPRRSRSSAAIVGESLAMQRVWRLIERVQDSDVAVLVQGETGTGKELIARAIHAGGARGRQPLVTVDCGALPVSLAESEFFGYRKGAFTDAHRDRAGLIEQASGGSIFIDEIGDITMELQAKLLRFLQEGTVRRIGDTRPIAVDVRVIAATNRDLRVLVQEGTFRQDLYYRLAVVPILVPPLRERREDIPLLIQHFSERIARDGGREGLAFTDAALAALFDHDWPGNVRELENMLRRLAALSAGALIGVDDLPASVRGALAGEVGSLRDAELAASARVARRMLEAALEASAGDVRAAARALGTPVKTVYYKLKRLGIDPARFRPRD